MATSQTLRFARSFVDTPVPRAGVFAFRARPLISEPRMDVGTADDLDPGGEQRMSGFTENRASGASERSGQPERILTWHASRAMLPLVSRIAQDIARRQEELARLRQELAQLEKNRLSLDWPRRHRRYQLEDEITARDVELRGLMGELELLGVALLDGNCGLVGFPTRVNDRPAYFSWQPGEELLGYWNYADSYDRRPVPEDWRELPMPRVRPRKSKK
jgi:hypothetical protein